MVVVSCLRVVSTGGSSMLAWTICVLLLALNLVQADPNTNYGREVIGDEVEIDRLEDYLRSQGREDAPPPPPRHLYALDGARGHASALRNFQKSREKIKFAVTPKDPRYYEPIIPDEGSNPLPPYLPPNLPPNLGDLRARLESRQPYPDVVNQYQDDEPQYQVNQYQEEQYAEYPVRDQYPGYLETIRHPGGEPYYDSRFEGVEDLRGMPRMNPDTPEEVQDSQIDGIKMAAKAGDIQNGRHDGDQVDSRENEIQDDDKSHKKIEVKNKKAAIKAATSQPEAVNYLNRSPAQAQRADYIVHEHDHQDQLGDVYFTAIVAGCTAAAVCAVIGAGMCWYRLNKSHRAAQDAEYPAYGVTGPNKDLSPTSDDRKLAQSAHMYHYQHQKQQMIALEKSSGGERHGSASDVDSEEEGEENEYTVYECPGLAPTGEMEVKNPLFHDDPTPATPSMRKEEEDDDDDDEDDEEQKAK